MTTEQPISKKDPIIKRTKRFYEKKRTITIVYEYNRETCELKYGASIHKKSQEPNDTFVKKNLKKTAEARFTKKPIIIPNFSDESSLKDFHHKIRKIIHKQGVADNPKST